MKKINIGLVGCGRVGDYYFDILKSNKIKNFELVAVCDENLEKTKKFKNKFKCKISKSYMDPKFYENLDAVLILTPSGSHFAIVKFFLQKKINVISEKPLTMLPKNSLILDKLAKK